MVYSDRYELNFFDETIRIQNFYLSQKLWKKLLEITEMTTLPKRALVPIYRRYRFQILIAQTEDFNADCVNEDFTSPSGYVFGHTILKII